MTIAMYASARYADVMDPTVGSGYAVGVNRLMRGVLDFVRPTSVEHWDLDVAADHLAGRPVVEILDELHDHFALQWVSIARLTGVSVTALNKWRNNGPVSAVRKTQLRQLLAFTRRVATVRPDVAGWFESAPVSGVPISRGDLYAAGGARELLHDAFQPTAGEELLDAVVPLWRTLLGPEAHLAAIVRDEVDGCYVAEVEELGLFVDGATEEEAREALVHEVRDLVTHALPSNVPMELAAELAALGDEALRRRLFGP